jgi:hypothetical protein
MMYVLETARQLVLYCKIKLIVRKCQPNESKSLSIETRRIVCHLCGPLGTSQSLRLRKFINPIIPPISHLSHFPSPLCLRQTTVYSQDDLYEA